MSKMVQIRDVPDEVHSLLKARAAREGMSLSDLLKRELQRAAERPAISQYVPDLHIENFEAQVARRTARHKSLRHENTSLIVNHFCGLSDTQSSQDFLHLTDK